MFINVYVCNIESNFCLETSVPEEDKTIFRIFGNKRSLWH